MQVKRITAAIAAIALLFLADSVLAANQMVIESVSIMPCDASQSIRISIENDVDLQSVTIPLMVRSITGGAFWRGPVDSLPATGRLATSLTGGRWFETGGVDFVSPDQIVLVYEASGASDCLPAGPLELMTGFVMGTNVSSGTFEIDTAMYAPCHAFEMLACSDGLPVAISAFTMGMVTILPGNHPFGLDIADDTLSAWAGATLENQAVPNNPSETPLGFRLVSGPGSVGEDTGWWSWASSPADSGMTVVSIQTFNLICGASYHTASFIVELRPLVPGDLNCDGVVNVFDVVLEVDMAFREGDPVIPCYDL